MKTKIETYKGVDIMFNSDSKKYYTEVVMRNGVSAGKEYSSANNVLSIKSEIDKFFSVRVIRSFTQKVWVRGSYADGRYKRVEIIFRNIQSNVITVRDKAGKISTISLSNYKFDEPKVFQDTPKNRRTISIMEAKQKALEALREHRAELKLTLTPYKK